VQQNNLIKAREEKYQSRIRVLEALAGGASGQTHVNSSTFFECFCQDFFTLQVNCLLARDMF
jgi:hypothetical protein